MTTYERLCGVIIYFGKNVLWDYVIYRNEHVKHMSEFFGKYTTKIVDVQKLKTQIGCVNFEYISGYVEDGKKMRKIVRERKGEPTTTRYLSKIEYERHIYG